jgi:heterodisulfide reductase subunit B
MATTGLNTALAEKIRAETGENVFACYQCAKCTAGCPLVSYFDLAPNQVMRAAQLGLDEQVLEAQTPWLCAGCQTCTTRCPNGIDVARVMDFMATEAQARGIEPKVPEIKRFNDVFLRHVKVFGRAYELGLAAELNVRNGEPLKDLGMGLKMLRKGKLKLLPERARPPDEVKPVAKDANTIGYYPGCSLHSVGSEYDHSVHAVAEALNLNLVEPEGWLCCGASPAHRVDPHLAAELPLRNLALIEKMNLDEVTLPCAACFGRFKIAQHEVTRNPALKAQLETEMRHTSEREVAVRTLVDVLVNRVGLEAISRRTSRPLAGLKVACYYGCLMTRPPSVGGSDNVEYPMQMDALIGALGATPVAWGSKTACCGASLSVTRTEIVLDLSSKILRDARAAGADVVAVACPLCHTNLDARQHQMNVAPQAAESPAESPAEVPVLYFTQLMALAFGLGPKDAALAKNMVDPAPVLKSKGLLG